MEYSVKMRKQRVWRSAWELRNISKYASNVSFGPAANMSFLVSPTCCFGTEGFGGNEAADEEEKGGVIESKLVSSSGLLLSPTIKCNNDSPLDRGS